MKTSLDLMTDDDRRRQLVQASLRLWGRILAASLAILIFVGTAEWWQGRSTSRQRQALEHRYAPLETLKYDCIRMRGEIVALQKAQRLTQSLVETRPTLTLLGSIAAAAAQTSGHVYVSQLDLEQAESSAAPRTAVVMGLGQDGVRLPSLRQGCGRVSCLPKLP